MWRRVGPGKGGQDELQYSNRRLEDEIRAEVDRDEQMAKGFGELEERRSKSEGGGEGG